MTQEASSVKSACDKAGEVSVWDLQAMLTASTNDGAIGASTSRTSYTPDPSTFISLYICTCAGRFWSCK